MKIGIYGLGRFGYFWAELLAGKFDVYAYNRSPEKPCPPSVTRCSLDELVECDVIFLCITISAFQKIIELLKDRLKPGTLVIDTCSVKSYPVSVMESMLGSDISFLATHPMFGPDSGKHGVAGLPMVICSGRCLESTENEWISVFTEMGMDIIKMTPEEHDREAAFTQGITHFVGRVLDELNLQQSRIGTKGYRSLLEIVEQTCNDPRQLFYDLQRYNPYTHDMRLQLRSSIEHTMEILQKADELDTR